jgi:hypothetical protein
MEGETEASRQPSAISHQRNPEETMTTATHPEYSGWHLNGDRDDLRFHDDGRISMNSKHLSRALRIGTVVLFSGNETQTDYGYARVETIAGDTITFTVLD